MLAMVSLPFFMQNILGYSAVQIGLLLTPWPLATILTAPLAGRLVEKVHPGLLGGIGMAIFATGLFTLYLLPPSGRMEYHLANGTLWYGLRAVPDAQ